MATFSLAFAPQSDCMLLEKLPGDGVDVLGLSSPLPLRYYRHHHLQLFHRHPPNTKPASWLTSAASMCTAREVSSCARDARASTVFIIFSFHHHPPKNNNNNNQTIIISIMADFCSIYIYRPGRKLLRYSSLPSGSRAVFTVFAIINFTTKPTQTPKHHHHHHGEFLRHLAPSLAHPNLLLHHRRSGRSMTEQWYRREATASKCGQRPSRHYRTACL